jgi:hypothetical protein
VDAPAAADVVVAAEARAVLDAAVALDADHGDAGGAAAPVLALGVAQASLERAEVAEVVAGPQADAAGLAAVEDLLEGLEELEEHVGLEDDLRVVGGVAVGRR